MARICTSLALNGYWVTLVGRLRKDSLELTNKPYNQKRIKCWFSKGKVFYIEFNIRLFFYLLFQKQDAFCAIDLDTILPVLWVSRLLGIPRIYDAHELFCEMKEIVERPLVYRCWKWIERAAVPHFPLGYTVCGPISMEFNRMYGVQYRVIRNLPLSAGQPTIPPARGSYILYQGAVNEGRSFETLIPAMRDVQLPLVICGDGNYMEKARSLVKQYGLGEKVIFTGMVLPADLVKYTRGAAIGITLFENASQSNYLSLANRFFDYIQAGVPQLCVNYPAYREINQEYEVAVLVDDLQPQTISQALNNLLGDDVLYRKLQSNCVKAAAVYNWQEEEKKLIGFYKQILN